MLKKISLLIIFSLLSINTVFAGATHCGDGNNFYSLDPTGTKVSYAGLKNEFDVTRVDDGRVIIEDQVKCRFGKDALREIQTVEFMDGEISVDDLVEHSAIRILALDVLKQQIQDAIAIESAKRGLLTAQDTVDAQSDSEQDSNSIVIDRGNITSPFSQFYGSNSSSQSLGSLQSNGFQNAPTSNNSGLYNQSLNTNNQTYFPQDNQNSFTNVQPFNNLIVVPITWDATQVGYYDVIFFEASFEGTAERRYLGSSTGFLGSADVQVPAELLGREGLKINVRSGTRVLSVIPIKLSN